MRSWLRSVAVLGVAGLVAGLLSVVGLGVSAGPALADAGCTALGGAGVPCVVPFGTHVVAPGAYTLGETLQLDPGAVIDARTTTNPPPLFKVTITAGDLLMDKGSKILTTDPDAFPNGNNDAGSIFLDVQAGNVVMQSDSQIYANNDTSGGRPGDIKINATQGNMTLCGVAAGQPGVCGGAGGTTGALISSQWNGGTADQTGTSVIEINVGDVSTLTGAFFMGGGSKTYQAETGARITANSDGASGVVKITAGRTYFTEPGSVVESGDGTGNANNHGGKIYIVAGCELTTEGRITSKGSDPGADLVHLEGCEVLVRGLVESTGKGHSENAKNNCDNVDDGLTKAGTGAPDYVGKDDEVFRPKPEHTTACLEIFSKKVTVDATLDVSTNPATQWAGELNADIGVAGTGGVSWIDVFGMCCDVTVKDGTGNNRTATVGGVDYQTTYAVHAIHISGTTDTTPNTITVLSCAMQQGCAGTLSGSGDMLLAGTSTNGGYGGTIVVEASNLINLDTANINADGDTVGSTPCTGPSGACGRGGHIFVKSYLGKLIWTNGVGTAMPNNPAGGPDISLTACNTDITTTGTTFTPLAEVTLNDSGCMGNPTIPTYTDVNPTTLLERWAHCGENSISGHKFLAGDTPVGLSGWTIHLYGPDVFNGAPVSTQTGAGGFYSFGNLTVGTYKICEVLLDNTWIQDQPGPGVPCTGTGEGPNGWLVNTGDSVGQCCSGATIENKDFTNHQRPEQVDCKKPTMIEGMNSAFPGNKGPDKTVLTFNGESVQDAVTNVTDVFPHDDGYLIVLVIAHSDGSLGGTAAQKVVVSKDYTAGGTVNKPFGLFGCSVTLTGDGTGGPALYITKDAKSGNGAFTVNGRLTTIFTMDLHGGNSAVGVQADGMYRYIRNTYGTNNGTGIKVCGDNNTVHNGKGEGNTGDGVYVKGNGNLLTDTDSFSNGGNGFTIVGNSNQLLKLNAGEKGKVNGGDGVHVVGNTNTLSEVKAYANSGDGIDVAGNSNSLKKNVTGDKGKGNGGDGIRVAGIGNRLEENVANTNTLNGFEISGGTNANVNNANWLKKNVSNSGNSAAVDTENVKAEYSLLNYVKNDGGGNKADNIVVPKTTAPTKCTAFPATNATVNFVAVSLCE